MRRIDGSGRDWELSGVVYCVFLAGVLGCMGVLGFVGYRRGFVCILVYCYGGNCLVKIW